MIINSEGIVLKQVKTAAGNKIIHLFTKKYGKISCGCNICENSRGRTSLALRAFTYGNYQLYKNKSYFIINSADVLKSYYKIGEDIEKYMISSYVLELTERALMEEVPNPKLFNLLIEFMSLIEERQKAYETLLIGFEVKLLIEMGTMPNVETCVACGNKEDLAWFDVKQGGLICNSCKKNESNLIEEHNDRLIYAVNFGIVDIMKYFKDKPLRSLEKLALPKDISEKLQIFIKSYMSFHLDINNLKSESFLK